MTDAQSNIDLVLRRIRRRDWRRLVDCPQSGSRRFHVAYPGAQPDRGRRRRYRCIRREAADVFNAGLNVEVLDVFGAGNHVATLQRNTAASEGGELDILVINLFTVIDGKLARMQTFPSDQYALDSFWGE